MANLIIQLSANLDPVGGVAAFIVGLMSPAETFAFSAAAFQTAADLIFGYGNTLAAGSGTAASPLTLTFQNDLADTPIPFPAIDASAVFGSYYQYQAAAGGSYTSATRDAAPGQPATAHVTLTDGPGGSPWSGNIGIDGVYFPIPTAFPGSGNWSLELQTGDEIYYLQYNTPGLLNPSPPSVDLSDLLLEDGVTSYVSDGGNYTSTLTFPGSDPVNQQDTLVATGTIGELTITTDVGATAGIPNNGAPATISSAISVAGVGYSFAVTLVSTTYQSAGAPPTYTYVIEFQNGSDGAGGTPPSAWSGSLSGLSSPITITGTVLQAGSYVALSSGAQGRGIITGGGM